MDRIGRILALAGAAAGLSTTQAWAQEAVTYTYDAQGRLTKVVRTGGPAGNITADYSYDDADNRSNVTVDTFQVITGTSGEDVLVGSATSDEINGLGNNDRLYGGGGNDRLIGGSGFDDLYGQDGNDTLEGGEGNDLLDGGPGADHMTGGNGHDTYIVDNLGDVAVEGGLGGTDFVESSVDFTLPTHFERLTLTGTFSIDGKGNSGDNWVTGNSGNNLLNGGSGDDRVDGQGGNDRIYGHTGNDYLVGGTADDFFFFNTSPGSDNIDEISDYVVADDTIYIANYAFTAVGPTGPLSSGAYRAGTVAADASDRIIYDSATGNIRYDADGTGSVAAIIFATVTPGTALAHTEFQVYD